MRTTLPRWAWLVLLPAYTFLGAAAYVFGRTQVAPCLGDGVFGGPSTCYETWLATRGLLLDLLDTPVPGIALVVALMAITYWRLRPYGDDQEAT